MKKTAWMMAVLLGLAGLAGGQSLGAGRQPIDVWASVYGTNTAATLSNVFEQVAGRELAIGIDRGAWLIDEDLLVPSNVTLFVKRGSYFLLTNSATMRICGELVAGSYEVFRQAPSGGATLVDGEGGSFLYVYPNWFSSGVDWTNMPGRITGNSIQVESSAWQALMRAYGDVAGAIPDFATLQSVADSADEWLAGLFGALEAIPTFETDTFYFMRDHDKTSVSNWDVVRTTWGASNVPIENWPDGADEEDEIVLFVHPPYVVADDIMFPAFVTKEEFYGILNAMGFANFDHYTFHSPGLYGSSNSPPPPNSTFIASDQVWTVPPTNMVSTGQVVRVHLWGAGGGSSGGYTYGELVVVSPETFGAGADPSHVTNGMQIVVHVGAGTQARTNNPGRAAIWRADTALDFSSWTNELMVAGGGGARSGPTRGSSSTAGVGGGETGGTALTSVSFSGNAIGGGGGGAAAGGAAGSPGTAVTPGVQVWGGRGANSTSGGYGGGGYGGDGRYGGGGGGSRAITVDSGERAVAAAGGGGSGYVRPGIQNGVTVAAPVAGSSGYPSALSETAYGGNAGYPGGHGRVAFELRFDSWKVPGTP